VEFNVKQVFSLTLLFLWILSIGLLIRPTAFIFAQRVFEQTVCVAVRVLCMVAHIVDLNLESVSCSLKLLILAWAILDTGE
jgi:hypothetical protein